MAQEPVGSTPSTRTSDLPRIAPDRVPPQDIEAEMSLLGSMLLERDVIGDVLPIIHRDETERFYRPNHRRLFEVLVDMYDRDEPVDMVTVRNELSRRSMLDEVGGVDYLVHLAESVPSYHNATRYAELVRDKALLRELIGAAHKISDEAHQHHEDATEILDRAEHLLFNVTDQRISEQIEPIKAYLEEIYRQLESRDGSFITGVPTGFLELDGYLSGLQKGEMIIVAARPSMGKTAFGLTVAEHVAVNQIPCAFFSMEMSKQAVVQRLLCSRARVDSHRVRRGMVNDQDMVKLNMVVDELHHSPMFVDDTPGMSVLELRAKARRMVMRHDAKVIFIDYLQLMHSPGRSESRQQEVSEISRGLKALARELDIPVVVLAQLNRNPEGRTDNRPRMSDLRESGAIEQDADVIMLLHREEYYKKHDAPDDIRGIAEVIIDKQRNGPTGIVKLHFSQQYTRFDNLHAGGNDDYGPPADYDQIPIDPPKKDPPPDASSSPDEDAPF